MTRHFAHCIKAEGNRYPMSVAEISDDRLTCTITPFAGEIHSTRFYNGEIEIRKDALGLYEVVTDKHIQTAGLCREIAVEKR